MDALFPDTLNFKEFNLVRFLLGVRLRLQAFTQKERFFMCILKRIIPLIVLSVCLIFLEFYLEKEDARKNVGEGTAVSSVSEGAVSEEAVSEDYEPGLSWNYAEGFSLPQSETDMAEINSLKVYSLEAEKDMEQIFNKIGKFLWGNKVGKAKFEVEEYKTEINTKEKRYFLTFDEEDYKKILTGYRCSFDYNIVGYRDPEMNEIIESEQRMDYINEFIKENKIGIWENEKCLSELIKLSEDEYSIRSRLGGRPISDGWYQTTFDGNTYADERAAMFYFDSQKRIKHIEEMACYQVLSTREMNKKYDSSALRELTGKAEQEIRRFFNTAVNVSGTMYERYNMEEADVRYIFIDKTNSMDGHIYAVPILEMRGTLLVYDTMYGSQDTSYVSVAVNLDSGNVIGSTTQRERGR